MIGRKIDQAVSGGLRGSINHFCLFDVKNTLERLDHILDLFSCTSVFAAGETNDIYPNILNAFDAVGLKTWLKMVWNQNL